MAITSGQTIVNLTPTHIAGNSTNPLRLHIHNADNQQNLFIGGDDVSISNGLIIQKLDSIELVLNPNESLYAISSQGNHLISWLRQDA
jgi:hypothetical protein